MSASGLGHANMDHPKTRRRRRSDVCLRPSILGSLAPHQRSLMSLPRLYDEQPLALDHEQLCLLRVKTFSTL